MGYAANNVGGVPLGYLFSFASIKILGYSTFSARLPSLIFSLGACVGVFVLARILHILRWWLATSVFLLLPLQFRYAIEARPYSAALCISIWSTVAFFRMIDHPNFNRTVVYGLIVVTGLYTQPFTVFVPLAHLTWSLSNSRQTRLIARKAGIAIAMACVIFLPWLLYTIPIWRAEVASRAINSHLGIKEIQLVLKEMLGIGYLGSALVLTAVFFGLKTIKKEFRVFWLLYIIVPIAGVLAADIVFGYFLAIRQMIFILAPLSLLAALGIERIAISRSGLAITMTAALLLASLYQNTYFFIRPRENWRAAAESLSQATKSGACVMLAPGNSTGLYDFFEPGIANNLCVSSPTHTNIIAVGISPYDDAKALAILERRLQLDGWIKVREYFFGGPRVVLYSRRS